MVRKRLGRNKQKDSESTTSSSSPGRMRKVRSRKSTRNTEEKSVGDSLDKSSRNTENSSTTSGSKSKIPLGKLKEQLDQALSQIRRTRSSLTKFKTHQQAEEFETEIKKYLPENIGVGIIRESEVNCYEIIYRTKEDKLLEERRIKQIRRAFLNRLSVSDDIEQEIKRARQRAYWAKKNKADKLKKGTPKAADRRSKK